MSERNRIVGIDSLKGFAILTVVFGHCIDWILKAEIYPNFNQILYVLFNFIYSFHMPLFFMISGLLFWYSKVYSRFKIKVIDFIWIDFIWEFIIWVFRYIFSNHATNLGISLYFFLSVVLGVGIPLLIAELSKHISIIKLLFSPYKTIKIYKSSF